MRDSHTRTSLGFVNFTRNEARTKFWSDMWSSDSCKHEGCFLTDCDAVYIGRQTLLSSEHEGCRHISADKRPPATHQNHTLHIRLYFKWMFVLQTTDKRATITGNVPNTCR